MTKAEFQERLDAMYKENPMIARSKKKTVNEIIFLLRQDKECDYNISMKEDGTWTCILSARETFIPVRTLAKHVKEIVFDKQDDEYEGICLTFVLYD